MSASRHVPSAFSKQGPDPELGGVLSASSAGVPASYPTVLPLWHSVSEGYAEDDRHRKLPFYLPPRSSSPRWTHTPIFSRPEVSVREQLACGAPSPC